MDKQEFLEKLRVSLNGRIPTTQVTDNVNYYDDYINTEIRKGRTKEEVMEALGDPRLIAKTIIQTQSGSSMNTAQSAEYREFNKEEQRGWDASGQYADRNTYGAYSGSSRRDAQDTRSREERGYEGNGWKDRFFRLPKWLWTVLSMLVIIVIIVVVFRVLSFLAPLLIVLSAVMLMVKIFRDWLN